MYEYEIAQFKFMTMLREIESCSDKQRKRAWALVAYNYGVLIRMKYKEISYDIQKHLNFLKIISQ